MSNEKKAARQETKAAQTNSSVNSTTNKVSKTPAAGEIVVNDNWEEGLALIQFRFHEKRELNDGGAAGLTEAWTLYALEHPLPTTLTFVWLSGGIMLVWREHVEQWRRTLRAYIDEPDWTNPVHPGNRMCAGCPLVRYEEGDDGHNS